ncbi:hypothetical protein NEMBOFW57_004079 [Staphylotrichum longicolle]|uniref:Uncharacterized protein n=1 Tax=Staphylotrichum longicolle TaxID=669026 RepID=A0AAD4I6E2_9PEZI|nr:hypothetical protein NEMBOFW57_004079 [Staphylotrichum longicolle]
MSWAGLERSTSLRPKDVATSRREVHDRAFRIYKWIQIHDFDDNAGYPLLQPRARSSVDDLNAARALLTSSTARPARELAIGEEVSTYATLDPALYTPTPSRPFRASGSPLRRARLRVPLGAPARRQRRRGGGVRRGHGGPAPRGRVGRGARRPQARRGVYRGRLEAVKLTGDVNVPRGEYSFVADDLGAAGLVGVGEHAPFEGVRMVRCRGHIAENGFRNDSYIDTRLLLISTDRLAHFWPELHHISYYQRVDIDSLLTPE